MNTGMQDAFNLAWKLALVSRGIADEEKLLSSYSAERSPVADAVLKGAGMMTEISVLHGSFKQSIRNHLAALVFGLSPVKKKAANSLTELSIGYPKSPLNGEGGYAGEGPTEGERAPVDAARPAIGAGHTPRFTLCAQEQDQRAAELITRHPDLLAPTLREPFVPDGLWLVRPDGYVALATRPNQWDAVERYLDALANGTCLDQEKL